MKSFSFSKENALVLFFLVLSATALYFVQTNRIAPKSETSTVLSDASSQSKIDKTVVHNDVTTPDLEGKLVSTNYKPEANREVTFSLEEFTPHPEANYYLKLGNQKLNFQNGILKYRFPTEGVIAAELRCAFRGQDVILDREMLEVSNRMTRSSAVSEYLEDN